MLGGSGHTAQRSFFAGGAAMTEGSLGLARCAHGRHRAQPRDDGSHVVVAQKLQAVLDGFSHAARRLPLAFHMARLQVGGDFRIRPRADAADLVGRDVRRMPGTERGAGQGLAADFRHQRIARRVAGAAVRQAFGQVGAAVDLHALRCVRHEALIVEEQGIPAQHRQAHIEREWQCRLARRLVDGLDGLHEVVIQVAHVRIRQLRIAGVGHGRIQVAAIGAHAFAQGARKVGFRVVADAAFFRRRDIRRVDRAQRRVDGVAARIRLAARCRMAGHAIGGDSQIAAPLQPCIGLASHGGGRAVRRQGDGRRRWRSVHGKRQAGRQGQAQ